jgi:hypothetical protein
MDKLNELIEVSERLLKDLQVSGGANPEALADLEAALIGAKGLHRSIRAFVNISAGRSRALCTLREATMRGLACGSTKMKTLGMLLIMVPLIGCGKDGARGPAGVPGPQGIPGSNGSGCTATTVAPGDAATPQGGTLVTCGNTSSMILNGTNAAVQSICPNDGAQFPEQYIQLGSDTYAILDVGGSAYLSKMVPDQEYETSDGAKCRFHVDRAGNVINE